MQDPMGCRVVRGPEWDSKDKDGGEGHVGTVVKYFRRRKTVGVVWGNDPEQVKKMGGVAGKCI